MQLLSSIKWIEYEMKVELWNDWIENEVRGKDIIQYMLDFVERFV